MYRYICTHIYIQSFSHTYRNIVLKRCRGCGNTALLKCKCIIYKCVYTHMYVYMYIHTCAYIYTCLYMCICVYINIYIYTYMYICIYIYIYIHIYTCTQTYKFIVFKILRGREDAVLFPREHSLYNNIYKYIHIYTHIYIHINIYK